MQLCLTWYHALISLPPQACEEVGIASFGADLPDTATQVRVHVCMRCMRYR